MSGVTQTPFHLVYVTLMSEDWRGTSIFCLLGLTPVLDSELPPTVNIVFKM